MSGKVAFFEVLANPGWWKPETENQVKKHRERRKKAVDPSVARVKGLKRNFMN